MDRRSFISLGALGLGGTTSVFADADSMTTGQPFVRFGLSSYSYWHFRPPKVSIAEVIEKAGQQGFQGVDILHRQMESEQGGYLRQLKRHAFAHGVDLISLSIHQDFVDPDPETVKKNVAHTVHCLEMAHEMGIPCIRLNSGRWGTIRSFDELMANRGEEPVLEGYSVDDGFKWCIDATYQCLKEAERLGVILALENHWGLSRTPEGLLRIADEIDSPWFGILMDTGNFLEDPYDRLEAIADKTVFVQAKTYYGGGEWYTLDLDYKRIARILKKADYKGYVSLEFEGKAPAEEGVERSLSMLRDAFTLS